MQQRCLCAWNSADAGPRCRDAGRLAAAGDLARRCPHGPVRRAGDRCRRNRVLAAVAFELLAPVFAGPLDPSRGDMLVIIEHAIGLFPRAGSLQHPQSSVGRPPVLRPGALAPLSFRTCCGSTCESLPSRCDSLFRYHSSRLQRLRFAAVKRQKALTVFSCAGPDVQSRPATIFRHRAYADLLAASP